MPSFQKVRPTVEYSTLPLKTVGGGGVSAASIAAASGSPITEAAARASASTGGNDTSGAPDVLFPADAGVSNAVDVNILMDGAAINGEKRVDDAKTVHEPSAEEKKDDDSKVMNGGAKRAREDDADPKAHTGTSSGDESPSPKRRRGQRDKMVHVEADKKKAGETEVIELDDDSDDDDETYGDSDSESTVPPKKKGASQPSAPPDAAEVVKGKTLPLDRTKVLLDQLKWLASRWNEQPACQTFKLADAQIEAIARLLPLSLLELSGCGLTELQIRFFGQVIVDQVLYFLREEKPQEENTAKKTSKDSRVQTANDNGGSEGKVDEESVKQKPKKPNNAFMFFSKDARPRIAKEAPGLTRSELGSKVGKEWKELSEDERRPYNDKAAVAKEKWNAAMATFREEHGEDASEETKKKRTKERQKCVSVEDSSQTGGANSASSILQYTKELRESIENTLPHISLSDATIRAIVGRAPTTSKELLECGLDAQQVRLFGPLIIQRVLGFIARNGLKKASDFPAAAMGRDAKNPTTSSGKAGPTTNLAPAGAPTAAMTATAQPAAPEPVHAPARPGPNNSQPLANRTANSTKVVNKTLERWSEYRIDAASTVEDLESIRRRLLSLLGRVDTRLKERRLHDALAEIGGVGGVGSEDVAELSTQELIDRLSAEVDTPAEGNDDIEQSESKGNANESSTCPLCFGKIATSSSCGSCDICEERNICEQCHSTCSSCQRATCADCLMGCDGCSRSYHCSDCISYGGGKCVVCRPQKRAVNYAHIPNGTLQGKAGNQNGALSTLSNLARFQQQHYPPPNALAYLSAPTLGNYPKPPPIASHPPRTQAAPKKAAKAAKPAQRYSIHRFVISEAGTMGLNITTQSKTNKCIISRVHPASIALNHGLTVGDELLPPNSSVGEGRPTPKEFFVYNQFLAAAKHRPIMFDVRRLFNPALLVDCQLGKTHALHRIIVTESGPLGLTFAPQTGKMSLMRIRAVKADSLAESYGLCAEDVICIPGTDGRVTTNVSAWFLEKARSGVRPFTFEVLRRIGTSPPIPASQKETGASNPFMFSFPGAESDSASGREAASNEQGKKGEPIVLLDDSGGEDEDSETEDNAEEDATKWLCDYCDRAFDTCKEATIHEATCKGNKPTSVPRRLFHAWVEDWETGILQKNCPEAEARLLEKYKGLVFFDPDNKTNYSVHDKELEWCEGDSGGWCVIAMPSEEGFEEEPFIIGDMIIELISDTPQASNIQIVRRAPGGGQG
ncbi:hypothetical protein ACHAXT_009499 [Thalassiosira profunda]